MTKNPDTILIDEIIERLNEVVENYKHKNNDAINDARTVGYLSCAEDILRIIFPD